jgi:hypothetical protein
MQIKKTTRLDGYNDFIGQSLLDRFESLSGSCLYLASVLRRGRKARNPRELGGNMKEPGRDARHRDNNGEINREHGNTIVRRLRKIYGSGLTPGFNDSDRLSTVLHKLDKSSLSQLHGDHGVGSLE